VSCRVGCIDEPVAIVQTGERFPFGNSTSRLRRLRSVRHLESLSAAMHTALVLSRLVSLTVGRRRVSACVFFFAAVAATVQAHSPSTSVYVADGGSASEIRRSFSDKRLTAERAKHAEKNQTLRPPRSPLLNGRLTLDSNDGRLTAEPRGRKAKTRPLRISAVNVDWTQGVVVRSHGRIVCCVHDRQLRRLS